jgi:hypothetical protein
MKRSRLLHTKSVLLAALLTLLAPLLALATLVFQYGTGTAQGPVELGTDTDPESNTATSLGSRDACVSVVAGDTFEFDIIVSDVDDLVAWELYLRFDPSIIEVVDADMDMFLANNPRSRLIKKWEPVSDGQHFLGAADRSLLGQSGSGVLARLAFQAKAPGFSHVDIPSIDFDGDGDIDKGPRLTASGGVPIGDVTGDSVFDPRPHNAVIAVNESCDAAPPIPTPPPSPPPQPGEGTTNPPDTSPAQPGGGTTPPGTSPPPDVLPVPGDPTFEPPPDTPPPTNDGPQSENGEDSTPEGEPEAPSEAGPDDEEVEGSATDGSGEEDGSAPVVLAGEGTPVPPESGDDSAPAPGGGSSTSSSSGGGFPLWAVVSIAAVLVAAAGTSVVLAARAGGRFWR